MATRGEHLCVGGPASGQRKSAAPGSLGPPVLSVAARGGPTGWIEFRYRLASFVVFRETRTYWVPADVPDVGLPTWVWDEMERALVDGAEDGR